MASRIIGIRQRSLPKSSIIILKTPFLAQAFEGFCHLSKNVELKDITDDYCVFGIFGPKSRALMQKLSSDDFSTENFKFANSKYIKIDGKEIWAQRLSYVGELGYELYVKTPDAKNVYEKIIEDGKVAVRNIRRDTLHKIHDYGKKENESEDEIKGREIELQDITDSHIKDLELHQENKEKELMEV